MKGALEFSALATKASAVSATVRAHQLRFPLVHEQFFFGGGGLTHVSDLTDLEPVLLALLSSHLDAQAAHVESLLTAMRANPLLASVALDADSVMAMELSLGRLGTPDPTRWRFGSKWCPSSNSLPASSSTWPPRARRPR